MVASPERSAVRKAGRFARQSLTGEARRSAQSKLIAHVQSVHAVLGAKSVGVFVAHDGEPDLQLLVDWLWAHGKTVALPVLADDPTDHTMAFVPWHQGEELVPGRYGIAIPPVPGRDSIEPDTVLVSLTAFDQRGGRMGRGGGFFDRYLATSPSQVVGVGFEAQRTNVVPVEAHDVPLPIMVTDLGVRLITRKPDEYRRNCGAIGKDGQPCE